MREIKFKAWDKKKKEIGVLTSNALKELLLNDCFNALQEDYELMQFTGLKDRNGKEIYEGDILMYRNNMSVKNPGVPFDSYHKVCFGEYDFGEYEDQEDGYGWYIQDVDVENYGSSLTPISSDMYEVIGNIYENPELIN